MSAIKQLMDVISDDEFFDELQDLQDEHVPEYYQGFHDHLEALDLASIANQMKFEYLVSIFHKYSLEQLEDMVNKDVPKETESLQDQVEELTYQLDQIRNII